MVVKKVEPPPWTPEPGLNNLHIIEKKRVELTIRQDWFFTGQGNKGFNTSTYLMTWGGLQTIVGAGARITLILHDTPKQVLFGSWSNSTERGPILGKEGDLWRSSSSMIIRASPLESVILHQVFN